jgi:signal transduction histidine kinase
MAEAPRVLLIEEAEAERALAKRLLESASVPAVVEEAGDALSFAEALAAEPPDVVVLATDVAFAPWERILASLRKRAACPAVLLVRPDAPAMPASADGSTAWVLRDAAGLLALPDVVHRLAHQLAPAESESPLRAALDRAAIPRFTCAPDGRLLEANDALRRIVGEVKPGENLLDALLPEGRRADLRWRLHTERVLRAEGLTFANGAVFDLTAVGAHGDDGEVRGVLIPKLRAQGPSGALTDRALRIAHDLKAPLRSLTRHAELLAAEHGPGLPEDARVLLAIVLEAAEGAQQQVERLFQAPAEEGWANAEEAFASACVNLSAALQESGAAVTHDPLPHLPVPKQELVTIFQNLIENAVKFRSARPLEVHVGARHELEGWHLWVADNGMGFHANESERIFDMFQRGRSAVRRPGTGIGLAVVKGIVERHGGRVWAESEEGATIHLALPERSDDAARTTSVDPVEPAHGSEGGD